MCCECVAFGALLDFFLRILLCLGVFFFEFFSEFFWGFDLGVLFGTFLRILPGGFG